MPLTPSPSLRFQEGERGNTAGGAPVPPASATPPALGSITCRNCKGNERPKLPGGEQEELGKNWPDAEWVIPKEKGENPHGSKGEKADCSPVLPMVLQGASSIYASIPDDKLH